MENSFSNLVSLILLLFCGTALASLIVLCLFRSLREHAHRNIIYGVSLFACGLCSYLYTTRYSGIATPLLRQMDHAAIFLLIAGTYTPFATKLILGPFRIRLLYWIWGIALTGVLLRLFIATGYDKAFVALYLAVGWSFLTALPDVLGKIPKPSLRFLGLGAVVYSCGALVFAIDVGTWTVPIWHIFVLTAAALHFVAVLMASFQKSQTLGIEAAAA